MKTQFSLFITGSLLIFLATQYTAQYSTNKTYLMRNCNTMMHCYSDDPIMHDSLFPLTHFPGWYRVLPLEDANDVY